MKEKSFSIVNFCQNLVGCRRKKSNTKRYDGELTPKNIVERILRRKAFPNRQLCEDHRSLSKSSPNLCAQTNENFTMKPTISIKRENSDDFHRKLRVQNSLYREENFFNFSVFEDDRKFFKVHNWSQQKSTAYNKRLQSFKQNNKKNLVKNFTSENKLIKSKSFMSCPNINQYFFSPRENMDSMENLDMIDNIDDFTTNLFLDDVIVDECNLDLVSIKFDYF